MEKGILKPEAKAEIQKQFEELEILYDYLSKNSQDEEIVSIQRRKEFVLLDGAIKVPKILMIKNASGVAQILNTFSKKFSSDEINEVIAKTGLNINDIALLMKDGMELSEIQEAADKLPFRDIAESSAIREMIRQGITPEQLSKMKAKGVSIEILPDGGIKQEVLTKIAEVNEKGEMKFDEEWFEKNLKPFAEMGLIKFSEKFFIKDNYEKNDSLETVSLEKKKEEETKEEQDKRKVANALGVEPDDILSIIRIEDREGGSKLLNYDMESVEKPLIIRLRNNKFLLVKEDENGEMTELLGTEITPVSKQVAYLLNNTPGAYTTLEKGDVKAGKTNPDQSEYNIFQIRRAGESKDDDSNNLLYVGCCGKTDMTIIESRENGELRFAKPPQSSIYPKSIYLENENGTSQKKEITTMGEDNSNAYISTKDISNRKETLKKLLEVEEKIDRIENHEEYSTPENSEDSEGLENNEVTLSDLYSERAQLLKDLGLKENEIIKEDEEYTLTRRTSQF